jgi:tRNA(fMet)-specific endonuclease VapC
MILLDTDHVTVLRYANDPRCTPLEVRLVASSEPPIGVTIVTLEEQMRGWLAEIHRRQDLLKQVSVYDQLASMMNFFRRWEMVRFDEAAAEKAQELRRQRIRIGTQDLKIAAIALVHNALLLSANLKDFRKVPGLRIDDWLP